MDPRLTCLAEYASTLSELVAMLESKRFSSAGVRTAWNRAEELLTLYQELESRAGLLSAPEAEELRTLARRAAGLNAVAAGLASQRSTRTTTELGRCRVAQGRLRSAVDDDSAGEYCDLAG